MSDKKLEARLFSSSNSWNELLLRAQTSARMDPHNKIGIAETSVQLLIIELNLKIILSKNGVTEKKLSGKGGHKLVWLFKQLDNCSREYICSELHREREYILNELKIIDDMNGTVGWRYLTFISDIEYPILKEHFCDTFIASLVNLTNHMVFKAYAEGKKKHTVHIINKRRVP